MNRRAYLTVGVGVVTALAGCSGGDSPEVDETVTDQAQYNVELESGDTIRAELDNQEGVISNVLIEDPDGEVVADSDVETEDTVTHEAEQTGTYRVFVVTQGRASIQVFVE